MRKQYFYITWRTCVCLATVLFIPGDCPGARATESTAAPTVTTAASNSIAQLSHALGVIYGEGLTNEFGVLDLDAVIRGLRDGYYRAEGTTSSSSALETVKKYREEKRAEIVRKKNEQIRQNQAKADSFLAQLDQRPGVVTLPSGLRYEILREGAGEPPEPVDTVRFNFQLKSLDGSLLEAKRSYRFEPRRTPMKGLQEALLLMRPGAHWRLYMAAGLAYGDNGRGELLEPGEGCIQDVELLELERAPDSGESLVGEPKSGP